MKCCDFSQLTGVQLYLQGSFAHFSHSRNFADDNFCLEWNKQLDVLIIDLEKKLEMITKWLKDSGLVVNESKTEMTNP